MTYKVVKAETGVEDLEKQLNNLLVEGWALKQIVKDVLIDKSSDIEYESLGNRGTILILCTI